MPDRREKVLRLACLVLGALLAFQLTHFVLHGNPTRGLIVPTVPSLPVPLEASASTATNGTKTEAKGHKPGTGGLSSTNQSNSTNSTDVAAGQSEKSTNSTKSEPQEQKSNTGTNSGSLVAQGSGTNQYTNEYLTVAKTTNSPPEKASTLSGTNSIATAPGTNSISNSTNLASSAPGTNSASSNGVGKATGPPGRPMNMAGKPPELPSEIKERVERITQGEILGQVIRPMPMALLGIAGQHAFLRSPEGQTEMVKEGDQLGTIKLLLIGSNRVLIEHEGEKKELTMFAGLGSETLLPKKEPKTNETTSKLP